MKFHLFPIITFVMIVATNAALRPELYWKSMLPNTPIPKSITDLLHFGQYTNSNDQKEEKLGYGGVNVGVYKGYHGSGTNVNVGVGHSPFDYLYAASETQSHDDPNVVLFFMEKDLHRGTKLNSHFTKASNEATFLPRQVADSIPFSSNKVKDILNKLSVEPGSDEAKIMKNTINECEAKGLKGEEKYCATSLESMVDFATSKLGKNIKAFSTEKAENETKLQKYTITQGVKNLADNNVVVCHKQNYPYAVFYCHKTDTTKAYFVPLESANGSRVKAIAVCHTDTSKWNPKHLAFKVLKVQPGTVPICHFLPEDHVVWLLK
ncbi:PREDICTED: BURP domain protein RD22-like isoform X1 [Lupinus angustifolius]|uniref:BURP domain protein RD22-like isoform X1 n=1 Tax=Lupinus angustifolius TaxID=3871 RepID=UPI00092F69BC|nr:PREDICTED: BURP domain protein RD22-like isoform X1 [Lupinus angustifolius]